MFEFQEQDILDISPLISPEIAVFPGDVPFSRQVSLSFEQGNHLLLSSINSTLHLGAHADAENHYHVSGKGIEGRELSTYIGNCQVLEVSLGPKERILPQHINLDAIQSPRILFKTNSFPDPNQWNPNFNALSPELITVLQEKKVRLIGIDTPSIDPADSKQLESHQAVYKFRLTILEGLLLSAVNPGQYTLLALPLKIKGADASPVRALLLPSR